MILKWNSRSGKCIGWSGIGKTIGLHVLFWLLIITYFTWGYGIDTTGPRIAVLNALFYLPGQAIMVYGLLYYLVPNFLLKKEFWNFFIGLVVLTLICATYAFVAQQFANRVPAFSGINLTTGRNVLPFIHIGAIAASVKLLKYWYLQRKQTIEAEQRRVVSELKLLKAQLHPHFLFNTLNNLYSHTLDFSPKSPEIVLKLTTLLRFMIYESNMPNIPMNKELELLRNYISLEQLRYGDRLDLSINVSGALENYQIAPLLLLPYLENAFKHGTSKQVYQSWISLELHMDNDTLLFKLENSIDEHSTDDLTNHGGIGLSNVFRRLQLLYKDKFRLSTEQQGDKYSVNLTLILEKFEE